MNDHDDAVAKLQARIVNLEAELGRARAQLQELTASGSVLAVTAASPSAAKVELFRSRFAGRTDVFAQRWTSKRTGKSGWSPVVRSGFWTGHETDVDFVALSDGAIERHLRGGSDVHFGIYPMLPGDLCRLLVCDFDDTDWQHDAAAYVAACRAAGLDVLAEISRSGDGAHVWMFFDEAVPAATARAVGLGLLRAAMTNAPSMTFASYDRFFPAQDTLPERSTGRARLGNLIALPLAGDCRRGATTVFADPHSWEPFDDQFAALSSCVPVALTQLMDVEASVAAAVGPSSTLGRRPRRGALRASAKAIAGQRLVVRRAAMIAVPTEPLPSAVITELKHLASLANPEFYRKQAQRFSTYGTPRFVSCFEIDAREIRLPRGLTDEVVMVLTEAGFTVSVDVDAAEATAIDVTFDGELRAQQQAAVDALLPHGTGVLVAPPGSGKTVIACALIAERKVSTAILVNRADLVVQWRERLTAFLSLTDKQIVQLGAGRRKRRGSVDVVMMQTVAHRNADPTLLNDYGQIIVDECHAVAAPAIEAALRQVHVPRWVGLTATPYRAVQLNGLITMQCGPIRHSMDAVVNGDRQAVVHDTAFTLDDVAHIQQIYTELCADAARNRLILADVASAARARRTCLVLTSRLDHLDHLVMGIRERCDAEVFGLHGRLSAAERRALRAQLAALDQDGVPFVLVAIDKIAGEGLDLPTLNTLFLAVPVSFKGRVIQQLGRVTRDHVDANTSAIVHDYRDSAVPVLARMHARRRRVMVAEGFVIT